MRQQIAPLTEQLKRLHLQLHQHLRLVQVTIHFQQVGQFRVHLVQVTIHFQQVGQFRVHHSDHRELAHLVQEWPDHVRVLFVQDLLHVQVHHVLHQVVHQQVQDFHHVQVAHHRLLLINQIHQVQVHQQVVRNVQVAVVHHNAVAQVEHSERMPARNQVVSKNLARHCAMNSTICKHHNWEEQLFLTVMEKLLFVCVAVLHWQISQTRLVQIQQR